MIELYFLGTGGSVATVDRDNTSFLLKKEKTRILVDCPGSIIQKLKKADCIPRKVQHILVTHIHPDHIYGLPSFVHSLMLEKTIVRLYGSEETISFSRKLLEFFNLFAREIKVRVEFFPLEPGAKTSLGDSIEVETIKVRHSSSSLAFKLYFAQEKKELLYSGDTPPDNSIFEQASGIDYLIHDCSAPSRFFRKYPQLCTVHTDSLELGQRAEEAGVKCLIPCHFFGEVEFSLHEIEGEIRQAYRGKLIIPRDMENIILNG
ncbi:MAG: MBL fold metallo-hydrolase [Candidatus Aminicenantales bacterium]